MEETRLFVDREATPVKEDNLDEAMREVIDLDGESEPARRRKRARRTGLDQAGPSRTRQPSTPRAN